MTIREQIMKECENHKTNFLRIDDLYGEENDYNEAKKGGYNFQSCPQSYECLKNKEELCYTDNELSEDTMKQCLQC